MNRPLLDCLPTRVGARRADALNAALARLAPLDLAHLGDAALQDRTDTKYLLTQAQAVAALAALRESYWVLAVDDRRLSAYATLYFDTPDLALYHAHHGGRRHVFKVRSRSYVESDLSFFEVKEKTGGDRTSKHRLPTAALLTALTPEAQALLAAYALPADALRPTLWNEYERVTLVAKTGRERVTLDFGLRFQQVGGPGRALPGVVTAEVKQAGLNRHSPWMQLMRQWGVRHSGFSKYCVGVSLLYPAVKHNNFAPQLRRLARVAEGAFYGPH